MSSIASMEASAETPSPGIFHAIAEDLFRAQMRKPSEPDRKVVKRGFGVAIDTEGATEIHVFSGTGWQIKALASEVGAWANNVPPESAIRLRELLKVKQVIDINSITFPVCGRIFEPNPRLKAIAAVAN